MENIKKIKVLNTDQRKILNFIENNYRNKKYILGPNWAIIKPSEKELQDYGKDFYYHSKEKKCYLCNSKFDYGQSNKIMCDCCKLIVICETCHKIFEYKWDCSGTTKKFIISELLNKRGLYLKCSKSCSNKSRKSHGTCPNCHHEDVDIYNGRCTYCANKELNSSINCPIHGFQKYSFGGKCIVCHNQTEEMREQARKVGIDNAKLWENEDFRNMMCGIFTEAWKNRSDENKNKILKNLNHKDICPIHGETTFIGRICSKCDPTIFSSNMLWNFSYNIECNKKCKLYLYCDDKSKKEDNLKNKYGNCRRSVIININPGKVFLFKCKKCGKETPHKLIKIDENHYHIKCLVCSGEYIWCDICKRWENKKFNNEKEHSVYWRNKIKSWVKENSNLIKSLKNIIINFNEDYLSKIGIYGWYINNSCVYIGESNNIYRRTLEHIYNMFEFPESWYNIIEHLDKNILEIKILEEIDHNNEKYKNLSAYDFKYNILKIKEKE